MIKLQEITYVTVITVEIPNPKGQGSRTVQASVKLLPHDMVKVVQEDAESGHLVLKPVRECTLAELMTFAEGLEQSIPEELNKIRLCDIAEAKNATLTLAPINDRAEELPSIEELFDGGAIVFPAGFEPYHQADAAEAKTKPVPRTKKVKSQKADTSPKPDAEQPPDSSDSELEEVEEIPILEEVEEIPIVKKGESIATPEPVAINDGPFEIVFFDELEVEEKENREPFVPETSEDNRLAGRKLELNTPYPSATDILFLEKAFTDAQDHLSLIHI